jgi:putative addiction module antidote
MKTPKQRSAGGAATAARGTARSPAAKRHGGTREAAASSAPDGPAVMKARVVQVGNSLGILLGREAAQRLKVRKGDVVSLVETPGGVELTPYDPEFEKQMAIAREGMAKFRNALRELAK